ncbi:hypothetical protein TVWG_00005 [Tetraselmis viridis virus N1]|uniref:Uncharacterized protein n=1 Tax=Tetraselmis viridis virus S1 TaxID=756285 RepID=M4QM72_9VIRU|nr:hypothetical protein TVSG_00021 [Tetraselmis viridis virus S1]AET84770.1 hypothetical protein TVWG_00005 [Tetraselmis viridis virus N1]AGH30821.1 hypothetical protein TVSG_00021 [Tetraselmis viridis virus S1]
MANAGLSDGFVFAPKPPAAPAANIRVSVPPYNKDVFKSGNETVMFNIPSGKRGQYLNTRMSYLTFELDVTVDADSPDNLPIIALDGGAHSFFHSLEVYNGSNLLEQIREYNTVYQILHDSGEIPDCSANGRSVAEGMQTQYVNGTVTTDDYRGGRLITPCVIGGENTGHHLSGNDLYVNSTTAAANITDGDSLTKDYEATAIKTRLVPDYDDLFTVGASLASGQYSATNHGAALLADKTKVVTYTFAIPIVSGILGVQMGKYIPVGALAADIRMELGLAPFTQAFKTIGNVTGTTLKMDPKSVFAAGEAGLSKYGISLKNFELQLEYVEVSSDVQMAIEASTGGQYVMSFDSYHDFQNTMPAGTGTITQLIGAKFSSIKTIYTAFRDQYMINNLAFPGITSRVNPYSVLPNRPEFKTNSLSAWSKNKYESGTGWQYMIGSTLYPPKPVASDQESFMEYVKSNHMVGNQTRQGLVDLTHWGISARRDDGGENSSGVPTHWQQYCMPGGAFLQAQNFESQSHKSHLTESGINTLAQTMYMVSKFPRRNKVGHLAYIDSTYAKGAVLLSNSNPATLTAGNNPITTAIPWVQTNQSLQVDHIIHYDGILIISNGVCSTRF